MSGESPEVQMARLDERLKTILSRLDEAKEDQKSQERWMGRMDTAMTAIHNRVENVENNLAKASPTIDEFLVIKAKVVGAGIFGKWLWLGLGGLIGLLASSRAAIFEWLSK